MRERGKGFTVVEVVVAAALLALIFSAVYGFLIHGMTSNEKGVRNIDAIQDMAFIIHNLRSDLRTLIEFPEEKDSYISFDPASGSLKFTSVSGVSDDGVILYSQVMYYFEKKEFFKKYVSLKDEAAIGKETKIRLAPKNKIKDVYFEICDESGKPVSADPVARAANPPKLLKAKIVHETNARLEVYVSLYSTYIKPENSSDKFWVAASQVIPMNPQFEVIAQAADVAIDMEGNPLLVRTRRGIRVGQNMGVPSSGQNVPDGE